jgi:hypothetical protein
LLYILAQIDIKLTSIFIVVREKQQKKNIYMRLIIWQVIYRLLNNFFLFFFSILLSFIGVRAVDAFDVEKCNVNDGQKRALKGELIIV